MLGGLAAVPGGGVWRCGMECAGGEGAEGLSAGDGGDGGVEGAGEAEERHICGVGWCWERVRLWRMLYGLLVALHREVKSTTIR